MCIDDYQFRHYSAYRPKQCRRFIFINQDQIQKTFLVNISQFEQNGQVALCKILFHLSSKGLLIENRKFYIPMYNISIQPGDYCKVPFQALLNRQMLFRSYLKTNVNNNQLYNNRSFIEIIDQQKEIQLYQRQSNNTIDHTNNKCQNCIKNNIEININQYKNEQKNTQTDQQIIYNNKIKSQQHIKYQQNNQKRIKQPQRKIYQVIIAVKTWRKLYQNKKMNLTKSAKLIGISKKSLDDYYLVIRIGQILGYNYQQNLQNKMGDLRAFIRTFNYKVSGKLTKQVKCFDLVPQINLQNFLNQTQNQKNNQTNQMEQQQQN